jgi:hypothetical protein
LILPFVRGLVRSVQSLMKAFEPDPRLDAAATRVAGHRPLLCCATLPVAGP